MSRVPGTNKYEFDYGGYKTDQDPFSLKTADGKSFSGPQIEIKSQRARVFIAGYDVTPDVMSLSTTQEREGHSSCSISLANPRNKYVVTKEDLLLYFDNTEDGITPVLKNSYTLSSYRYTQAAAPDRGTWKNPDSPFKDFGHPNQVDLKNVYAHEVNNVYTQETPGNVSPEMTFKEMLWKVKRHSGIYKFEGDPIFDFKEPIIVFLQGRYSSFWYFGFTGFLTGYNKNFDYGGEPAIEITGSSRKYQFSLQTEVTSPSLSQELALEGRNVNNRSDASMNNLLKNFVNGKTLKDAIINMFLKFVQDDKLGGLPAIPVNYWEPSYVKFFEEVLRTNEDKDNYAIRSTKQKFFENGFNVLQSAVFGLWYKIVTHIVSPDKGRGVFEVGGDTPNVLCATEIDTKSFYKSIKIVNIPNNPDEATVVEKKDSKTTKQTETPPSKPRNPGDPLNSNYSFILGDSIYQVNVFTVKPYTTSNVHNILDSNTVRLWESNFKYDSDNCKWESDQSVAAIGLHPALTEDFINKFHILPKIYGITRDHSSLRVRKKEVLKEVTVTEGRDVEADVKLPINLSSSGYDQGMSNLQTTSQEKIIKELNNAAQRLLEQVDSVQSFQVIIRAHDDLARWVYRGFLTSKENGTGKSPQAKDLNYEKRWFGKYNNTGEPQKALIPKSILPQFEKATALDNYDSDQGAKNAFRNMENQFYISEENFEADKLLSFTRAAGVAEFMARVIQVVDAVSDDGKSIDRSKLKWNPIDTTPNRSQKGIYEFDGSRLGIFKGDQNVLSKLNYLIQLKLKKKPVWEKLKEAIGYEFDDDSASLEVKNSNVKIEGYGWSEPKYTYTGSFEELQKATHKMAMLIWRTNVTGLSAKERQEAKDNQLKPYLVLNGDTPVIISRDSESEFASQIPASIKKFKTPEALRQALSKATFDVLSISRANKAIGSSANYRAIAYRDIQHVIDVLSGFDFNTRLGLAGDKEEYRKKMIAILASDITKKGRNANRRFDVDFKPVGAKKITRQEPVTQKVPEYVDVVDICIEQADRTPYDKLKEQVFGVPTEANPMVTGFNLHRPKFILMLPPLYMSSSHPLTTQFRQFFLFDNETSSIETLLDSLKEHMQFNYYETPMGDIVFEPYNYDMNPAYQVPAYLNLPAGLITQKEEYEIDGESFFGLPEDAPDDPNGQKMTYLPVAPTYISMKFSPKKLRMNRLPIVAPKRYFRHPYYFSDIDEKSISFNFDSSNIFSRIIVTGNKVGGFEGTVNPLADKSKIDEIRLYGRLQGLAATRDLIDDAIPFGVYVADGFEDATVSFDENLVTTGLGTQLRAKAASLHRAVLMDREEEFSSLLQSINLNPSRIGGTLAEFIKNNIVDLANKVIDEKNREIKKQNKERQEKSGKNNPADDLKEIDKLYTRDFSQEAFNTLITTLHTAVKGINFSIDRVPKERKPAAKAGDPEITNYLADFPMYDSKKNIVADQEGARLGALDVYFQSKKVFPTNSDPNATNYSAVKRRTVTENEEKFKQLLFAYCRFIVDRSPFGEKINKAISDRTKEKSDLKNKEVKERSVFKADDYAKARKEGRYNPMSDFVSLYGIKEAPVVHVNYLQESVTCQIYAIALFNQYYNGAYKYEYSDLALTPEWLVNRTGYFEYENFISLIDSITHSWQPGGTPSSSISTSYLRRNILHYKNGVVELDGNLTGGNNPSAPNFVQSVTMEDELNYTKKFSAFRRLGAVHESLIESIREDGEPSQAELLSNRLKLIPKLRAAANLLKDQYSRWVSQAKSEIDTKYNVYLSDLKETLKNIFKIRNSLFILGFDIEKDKAFIDFFEAEIQKNFAEQQIKNQTINSLLQENRTLEEEKKTLLAEKDAKKNSTNPVDVVSVAQIDARLGSIDAIIATNTNLADNFIPDLIKQLEEERQGYLKEKSKLEKQVVEKKDSIDPRIKSNSEAALKAELEKEENKKKYIERRIESFLKYFSDSVGLHMGVVFSSQKSTFSSVAYFVTFSNRNINNMDDVTFMVRYLATHFGNEGGRGDAPDLKYDEYYLPIYKTSADKRGIVLQPDKPTLSELISPEVNKDKGLVVENVQATLQNGFDSAVDSTLLSNFQKVPPLVVAIRAIQNRIDAAIEAEKKFGGGT